MASYRDNEPSVEEILGSIKRIIAEKDGLAGRRAARKPARSRQDDILDLDDAMIADDDLGEAYEDGDMPMLSDDAARSVRHSFEALATMSEPGAVPRIVRSDETSLESMVREMLKPMLKEWLDQNLPAMVEQVVAREIKRIGGRGKR